MNPKDKDGTRLLKAKVRAKQETQIFNEVKRSKKTMKLKYKGHFNLRASGIDFGGVRTEKMVATSENFNLRTRGIDIFDLEGRAKMVLISYLICFYFHKGEDRS